MARGAPGMAGAALVRGCCADALDLTGSMTLPPTSYSAMPSHENTQSKRNENLVVKRSTEPYALVPYAGLTRVHGTEHPINRHALSGPQAVLAGLG